MTLEFSNTFIFCKKLILQKKKIITFGSVIFVLFKKTVQFAEAVLYFSIEGCVIKPKVFDLGETRLIIFDIYFFKQFVFNVFKLVSLW